MHPLSHSKLTQIILGIVAIIIPFVIGYFIWFDIQNTFSQKQAAHIYYQLGEKYKKVNISEHEIFEYENPNARICLSVNDDHYCLPLDIKSDFIKEFGAQNVSLTELDENDNASAGINILEVPDFRY